jgi:hypothetical protein
MSLFFLPFQIDDDIQCYYIVLIVLVQLVNDMKINNQFIEDPEDIETIIGSTLSLSHPTESLDESQVICCKKKFSILEKT